MLALVILPLTAIEALATAFAWLALGPTPTAAVALLNVCALASAPLCVFFAVWRGVGIQAYVLIAISLLGGFMGCQWLQHFHQAQYPLSLASAIAALSVLLAFVLTRWALLHSSRAYRVQANTSVGFLMANR
jgi:hypothetical protein